MTALAGIMAPHAAYPLDITVDAMLAAQARYATSPPARRTIDQVSFGRALHPMLAEDAFDTGPQISSDGHILCVADVRLDNRAKLFADLAIAPSVATTMCDAALVLVAWQAWGTATFDRLRGDFAIAIHDRQQQRLILARDFLGQRPLFYHQAAEMLAFASMPSGLLALPSLAAQPDRVALTDYLASRRCPPLRSFFDGITPVPAGHWLSYDGHDIECQRYWRPPAKGSAAGDRQGRTAKARALFDKAVAARLRDATVVASHLSGGMDSGAVTLAAAHQLSAEQRMMAYTAVPPPGLVIPIPSGRFIDESRLAALSAGNANNIDHHCVSAEPADLSNRWDHAVALFQRPLHGPCNYRWVAAIYDAAQFAGVTTLLIGQVGNLSISYELPASSPLVSASVPQWRRRLRPLARYVRGLTRLARNGWRSHHFVHSAAMVAPTTEAPSLTGADERVAALALLDFGQNGKAVLAGWGIDLRDPTADRDLIDFCMSLPDDDFMEAGRGRGLARRALADLLPPAVLNDHRRGLQSADWRLAMLTDRAALLDEVQQAREHPVACSLIDGDALQAALLSMGRDVSLGQSDEALLRLGGLRALAASHFIRSTFGCPPDDADEMPRHNGI